MSLERALERREKKEGLLLARRTVGCQRRRVGRERERIFTHLRFCSANSQRLRRRTTAHTTTAQLPPLLFFILPPPPFNILFLAKACDSVTFQQQRRFRAALLCSRRRRRSRSRLEASGARAQSSRQQKQKRTHTRAKLANKRTTSQRRAESTRAHTPRPFWQANAVSHPFAVKQLFRRLSSLWDDNENEARARQIGNKFSAAAAANEEDEVQVEARKRCVSTAERRVATTRTCAKPRRLTRRTSEERSRTQTRKSLK